MGLPWIKLHATLPRHPKSIELGELLQLDRAWSYFVALLLDCAEFSPDATLIGSEADLVRKVERAAGWSYPKRTGELFAAMVQVGFLDRIDGGVRVHNWDIHQLGHIEKARKDAERKRRQRERPRDGADLSAGRPRDIRGTARVEGLVAPVDTTPQPQALVLQAQEPKPQKTRAPPKPSQQQEFYAWAMEERGKAFPNELPDAPLHPTVLNSVLKEPLRQAGEPGLKKGWLAYMATDYAKNVCSPPAAFKPFLSQWSRHVGSAAQGGPRIDPNKPGRYPAEASRAALEAMADELGGDYK